MVRENGVPFRCHQGGTGVVHTRGKTYIRQLVSQRKPSYLFSISTLMSFGLFLKTHLWTSIIVTLEYTVSKHVKLFDSLLDLNEHLVNQMSSSPASSRPGNNCFICVRVHGFPICVPSFCKKGKTLKTDTGFCRSWGRSETSVKTIRTELPALICTKSIHTAGEKEKKYYYLQILIHWRDYK